MKPQLKEGAKARSRRPAGAWLWGCVLAWLCFGSLAALAQESSKVRAGLPQFEPLIYQDAAGKPSGLAAVVLEETAKEHHWQLEYVRGSMADLKEKLAKGEIDLLTPAESVPTSELPSTSVPLVNSWGTIYQVRGPRLRSFTAVDEKRVALVRGDLHTDTFKLRALRFGLNCTYVETDTAAQAVERLIRNEADVVVLDQMDAAATGRGKRLLQMDIEFHPVPIVFTATPGAAHLLPKIDQTLTRLNTTPTGRFLDAITKMRQLERHPNSVNRMLVYALLAVAAGSVVFALFTLMTARSNAKLRKEAAERERATKALMESESRMRAFLDATPLATIGLDPEGLVLFWNAAAERTYGWSAAEVLGKWLPFVGPEDAAATAKYRQQLLQGRSVRDLVVERTRRDGRRIKLNYSAEPLIENGGTPVGMVVVGMDITEQHQAQEALKTSERLLRHMGEVGKIGGWELEIPSLKTRWTEVVLRLHEIPEGAEPSLAAALDFYPGEARHQVEKAIDDAINRGLSWDLELPFHTSKGDRLWVRSIGQPLVVDGKTVSISGTLQDITERKQVAMALFESQRRLALATESAQVGIWDLDLKSNDLVWDATMAQLYGLATARASRMTFAAWRELIHPDDQPQLERFFTQAAVENSTVSVVCRTRLPQGQERHLQFFARVLEDEMNLPARIVGTNWDVTARVEAETILRKAKEAAEEADRSKSNFLAMMSHEIRTPLNAIIGFSDLLKYSNLAPEQKIWLKHVEDSGSALLALVEDILDYSKIEQGTLDLDIQPFQPREMLEEACGDQRIYAREKRLEFNYACGDSVPEILEGDVRRIRQIIGILVNNAIKFTAEGSVRVWLEARHVEGGLPEDPAAVPVHQYVLTIRVVDTGIGIPPEVVPKLFKPFTQADSSSTRRFEGAGLGLSISQRLAEMMHGVVEVAESREGQGSTFSCQLLLNGPPPQRQAPPETEEGPGDDDYSAEARAARLGHLRVLIAEDHPLNQRLIHAYLRHLGFQHIAIAQDGLQVVEKFREQMYDIVMMDLRMPRMDGLSATRELRRELEQKQRDGAPQTPVAIFALTANATPENREQCLLQGMDGFLTKPLVLKQLEAVIDAWLQDHPELLRNKTPRSE